MRGVVSDRRSPIAYGYDAQVPVYFSQDPVLNVAGGGVGAFGGGGGRGGDGLPGVGMNTTPMAARRHSSGCRHGIRRTRCHRRCRPRAAVVGVRAVMRAGGRGGRGGGGRGGFGAADPPESRPRVIVSFPTNPDEMLLSGVLVGGQSLAGRAQVVDAPVGQGHVVMFAIRPFWRWQTQGTFFLGFNAILNWNDLDAGRQRRVPHRLLSERGSLKEP